VTLVTDMNNRGCDLNSDNECHRRFNNRPAEPNDITAVTNFGFSVFVL